MQSNPIEGIPVVTSMAASHVQSIGEPVVQIVDDRGGRQSIVFTQRTCREGQGDTRSTRFVPYTAQDGWLHPMAVL